MGTSKGYIAPTTPAWSASKSAVTRMANNPTHANVAVAASKFGQAMNNASVFNATFAKGVSNFLGLLGQINRSGIETVLQTYGREDLANLSVAEVLESLMQDIENASTVAEALVTDAISETLKNLGIEEWEQLGQLDMEIALRELLASYASLQFDFHFSEKILKDNTTIAAKQILDKAKGYIRGTIYENLPKEKLDTFNFSNMPEISYIEQLCNEAFSLLTETGYGE